MAGPFTTTTNETTNGGLDLISAVFETAVQPVASPTVVTNTQRAAQTLPVVATLGDPLVPLDPTATRLEAPAAATADAGGTVVVVPGEGRYELARAAEIVLSRPSPPFRERRRQCCAKFTPPRVTPSSRRQFQQEARKHGPLITVEITHISIGNSPVGELIVAIIVVHPGGLRVGFVAQLFST